MPPVPRVPPLTALFGCLALTLASSASAVSDAERVQSYREFRTLFDAHRYVDALAVAEKLVSMTEQQYGADDLALVNPLANLATTLYRIGRYPDAERQYLRCLHILDAKATNSDRRLLRPLHGLGATYVAAGEYAEAASTLKRAVDLSRNLDGLFNLGQLEILQPLIASYVALERTQDAEKEHQYAFRVAESSFGKDDPRLIGPLDYYARWYEFVGRYTSARALHARALTIAEQGVGPASLATVEPLRGLARTYRLEFLNGPEEGSDAAPQNDPFGAPQSIQPLSAAGTRLNPDGERALKLALNALAKARPPEHRRTGETLLELGDWYLISAVGPKAVESYRLAWKELQAADALSQVRQPRPLAYRPPAGAASRVRGDLSGYEEHFVEVRFTVRRDGVIADVSTASTDAPQNLERAVLAAVKKARYAPRIDNGEPVDAPDTRLRERVLVKRPADKSK